ncbi:MAG: metal ABC transporter permease [Elusimicrobiales bacterium]
MSELAALWKFFAPGLAAGMILAAVCGALGVLVITKRVTFVGMALSEVAACGLAFGLLLLHHVEASMPVFAEAWGGAITMSAAVAATAVAVSILALASGARRISQDGVMGILFALAGAGSILLVSYSSFGLDEVKDLLWGNLLVAKPADLALSAAVLLPALLALIVFLPRIVLVFTDADLARLLGVRTKAWELAFFYALGVVAAVGSKVGGSLLVFAYLVAPSCAGLLLARRMGKAMLISSCIAAACTAAGLYLSVRFDAPASQLVIALLCLSPLAALGISRIGRI